MMETCYKTRSRNFVSVEEARQKIKQSLEATILTKNSIRSKKVSELVGMEEIEEDVCDSLLWRRTEFSKVKMMGERSYLFFGLTGTGKSALLQRIAATAMEENIKVFWIPPFGFSAFPHSMGNSPVEILFNLAQEHAPSLIIMDDFECHALQESGNSLTREGISALYGLMSQLKLLGRGQYEGVRFMAATREPEIIDHRVLCRIKTKVYLELPDFKVRCDMFRKLYSNQLSEEELFSLARITKGFPGSEIERIHENVVWEACCEPLIASGVAGKISGVEKVPPLVLTPLNKSILFRCARAGRCFLSDDLKRSIETFAKENTGWVPHPDTQPTPIPHPYTQPAPSSCFDTILQCCCSFLSWIC